jgi:hypothetical protein
MGVTPIFIFDSDEDWFPVAWRSRSPRRIRDSGARTVRSMGPPRSQGSTTPAPGWTSLAT